MWKGRDHLTLFYMQNITPNSAGIFIYSITAPPPMHIIITIHPDIHHSPSNAPLSLVAAPVNAGSFGSPEPVGPPMPDTVEYRIVEVAPVDGSMTTMPVPEGASLRMIPFGRVMGAPPALNRVPDTMTPGPGMSVAVTVSPFGSVITTPAVGVAAFGAGILSVLGAWPGAVITTCEGSSIDRVVPSTTTGGAPAVKV